MVNPRSQPGNGMKIALVAAPLLAILVASLWYAARAWTSLSGPPMPATGYVAMTIGIIFSLVVGFVLMALVFYSSRHGYDDAHRAEDE
jgi:cation transporter-like permease